MNINEIKNQFIKVLQYSQDYDFELNVDDIFLNWENNKKNIKEVFGFSDDVLIKELGKVDIPIERYNSEENEIISFCGYEDLLTNDKALSDFTYRQRDGFYDNKVVNDDKAPDGTKINRGMKLSKSFKYFIKDENKLRQCQDKISECIQRQRANITGTLCVSIHPLDYLSISENRYDWTSCHALDGDYRTGNLAYMQDPSTVIFYIKSDEDVILPNFPSDVPWNNKKWRLLMYLSTDKQIIMASRQYPCKINNDIFSLIKPFLGVSTWELEWSNFCSNWVHEGPRYGVGKMCYTDYDFLSTKNLIRNFGNPYHYNDLMREDNMFAYRMPDDTSHFEIGHDVNCIKCGCDLAMDSNDMLCLKCECEYGNSDSEDFCYCEECGERNYYEDLYYVHRSNTELLYCRNCIEEYTESCSNCGEYYDVRGTERLDEDGLCPYCHEHKNDEPLEF